MPSPCPTRAAATRTHQTPTTTQGRAGQVQGLPPFAHTPHTARWRDGGACAACAPAVMYLLNAVCACAAAAGQQSNEESIEFGDEDESRDDGSPGKRPKGQVLCARQPRPPAVPALADAPRDLDDAAGDEP